MIISNKLYNIIDNRMVIKKDINCIDSNLLYLIFEFVSNKLIYKNEVDNSIVISSNYGNIKNHNLVGFLINKKTKQTKIEKKYDECNIYDNELFYSYYEYCYYYLNIERQNVRILKIQHREIKLIKRVFCFNCFRSTYCHINGCSEFEKYALFKPTYIRHNYFINKEVQIIGRAVRFSKKKNKKLDEIKKSKYCGIKNSLKNRENRIKKSELKINNNNYKKNKQKMKVYNYSRKR